MSQSPDYPHYAAKLGEKGSLGRVARTGVMWAYVRSIVMAAVAIPTAIVLARLLTPAEFGIAAAATFFGQLAGRLANGGMGNALVRVKDLREEHISSVFVLNAVLSLLAAGALVAAAPYVGAFYGSPQVGALLPLVAVNFLLGALSTVQQALLSRDLRYREMAAIGSVDVAVAAVAAVTFAVLGYSYWSLVLGDICGSATKLVLGVRYVGWHARLRFVPSAARELSSFAFGSYARRLLEHLTRNVDNLVIGRMLGVGALGFYDKAFTSANKVYNRMTVVGPGVSFRVFSIMQDDPERFARTFRKIIMTVTLVGYLAFAALGTTAPHLIVVAFGENWRPAVVPFQLLCVAFSFRLLNQFATSASQARGWIWPQVWRQAAQVVFVIAGVWLATPFGINGAAAAVLAATILMFFMTQHMMHKATGLDWSDLLEPQVPALAGTTVLVALLWLLDVFVSRAVPEPAIVLLVQAAAGGAFLLAFARWCPFADARDVMHEVVSDLSPRLAGWMWKDVAAARLEDKTRRRTRAGRTPPAEDAAASVPQDAHAGL